MLKKKIRTVFSRSCLILIAACFGSFMLGAFYGEFKTGYHSISSGNASPAIVSNWIPGESFCLNTCPKASDGICHDGRKQKSKFEVRMVECDLGTDCDDCGPWVASGPAHWLEKGRTPRPGPVTVLMSMGVEVRVRRTLTVPEFDFAYTDPTLDIDVSDKVEHNGGLELGITKIFYQIFKGKCNSTASRERPLFVDVGANFGWFSILAAAMGCRVIAFEPVPRFLAFFEYTLHLNGLMPHVDVRTRIVSHTANEDVEMVFPSRGIWGTAGIAGLNIDETTKESEKTKILIPSVRLQDVIKEDVLLLKVDVEGWEWSVFKGAIGLIKDFKVENIIMEYSPGVFYRHKMYDDLTSTVDMLLYLCDAGFRIGHIGQKHTEPDFDSPLESLEEVDKITLAYDVEDLLRLKNGTLGCPVHKELAKYKSWDVCMRLPEDLNPRSFQSIITFNTNLWAVRRAEASSQGLLKLEGHVGVVKHDEDLKGYFVKPGSIFGMGGSSRPCATLSANVQVSHRCPCLNKTQCGEEEATVLRLAHLGELANNYELEKHA